MSRDAILGRIRSALGRHPGMPPASVPDTRIQVSQAERADLILMFVTAVEKLAAKTYIAATAGDARAYISESIRGRRAFASNSRVLQEFGISSLPEVLTGISEAVEYRSACAAAEVGITGADYALADTGTLVMFSGAEEARMISLLPPLHIAVLRADRILSGLDELLTREPTPTERSSSMVLITGPSRTGDIEQILVRGVHGPGELHIVIL